jgi:hypothetical protein
VEYFSLIGNLSFGPRRISWLLAGKSNHLKPLDEDIGKLGAKRLDAITDAQLFDLEAIARLFICTHRKK